MTACSPEDLARLVAPQGKEPIHPTAEQRAVITAPHDTPLLVVAGAGSGKTETMSQRVLWLVANGHVAPDEVLGLTFTRKAAGELSERIRRQLRRLAASAEVDDERLTDSFLAPTVSTYNSFAGRIVSEFGDLAGVHTEATLIDAATAWRIARDVVVNSSDPALVETDTEPTQLTKQVIALSHAITENLVADDDVADFATRFQRVFDLPYSDTDESRAYTQRDRQVFERIAHLELLLPLVRDYQAAKRRRNAIEFSDQVALALRVVRSAPAVADELRERFTVVLLDEYQDTSVAQTTLLSTLFANHSVTAVGDPHQSIYGWRGASASNLAEYREAFKMTLEPLQLSTSWRNSTEVLRAANALVHPLVEAAPVSVQALAPRPSADHGSVQLSYTETIEDEFAELAIWLRDRRAAGAAATGETPSCAVIVRRRSVMPSIAEALTAAGVPNEIVGLGGLLATSEITDIIAALNCIWRVDAGAHLIRLLSGPRWRIGVADLAQLRELARWLSKRDEHHQKLPQDVLDAQRAMQLPASDATIIEALDTLTHLAESHWFAERFSAAGWQRLRDAGRVLADLRRKTSLGLNALVREVELALNLDLELAANHTRFANAQAHSRANLDAFSDQVANFVATDADATLASFLDWLDSAQDDDELDQQGIEPNPAAVQIITVHGAKGLEWDYVVVPRLVDTEVPKKPMSTLGWLSTAELPYELRGDKDNLPRFDWQSAATKHDVLERFAAFKADVSAHLYEEERRLIYVAVTRARHEVLLTGSFWSSAKEPRNPSVYLAELAEAGVVGRVEAIDPAAERPPGSEPTPVEWPFDPLGGRRAQVELAADAVRHACATLQASTADLDVARAQHPLLNLLLAEHDHAELSVLTIDDFSVSASGFGEALDNPEEFVRSRLRPMPTQPFRQSKLGTQFHHWVQRTLGSARGSELTVFDLDPQHGFDDDASSQRFSVDDEKMQRLKENFLASRWGDRRAFALEEAIVMKFAGSTVRCQIDAIYQNDDNTYEIVDWKTGKAPKTESDVRNRMRQLQIYRHAFAQATDVPPENIRCVLFYVAENSIYESDDVIALEELERQYRESVGGVLQRSFGDYR